MEDDPTPKSDDSTRRSSGPLGNLVQAESVIQMALAVPAGCFAGLLIGYLLDKRFHTHWMVVAGMLLGAAGGFIQIFTSMSRMSSRPSKQGDE